MKHCCCGEVFAGGHHPIMGISVVVVVVCESRGLFFSAANYLMMREGKGDTKRYLKCEKISFSESFCVDNFGIIHRTSLKKPIVGFYEGTLF